jgi:hypothetical protein
MLQKEYFEDYEYVTNSHLKNYEHCPYFYSEKKAGKVVEIEKDYFTYGKLVDTILSGENFEDKFFIGSTPKETPEELREAIGVLENEISERASSGKAPLKSKIDRLEKLFKKLDLAMASEGKIGVTGTVMVHASATAKEMKFQPLYRAFDKCSPQTIIATEIDTPNFKNVKVKGMIDKLDLENKILCDDKTTANMTTFNPEMYVQQLAWYRMLVRKAHGITVDCYLAVGDKFTDFKRSGFYYVSPGRLDYQEELNIELLERLLLDKEFKAVSEIDPKNIEEKCWKC